VSITNRQGPGGLALYLRDCVGRKRLDRRFRYICEFRRRGLWGTWGRAIRNGGGKGGSYWEIMADVKDSAR